jgi:hypothetical protein
VVLFSHILLHSSYASNSTCAAHSSLQQLRQTTAPPTVTLPAMYPITAVLAHVRIDLLSPLEPHAATVAYPFCGSVLRASEPPVNISPRLQQARPRIADFFSACILSNWDSSWSAAFYSQRNSLAPSPLTPRLPPSFCPRPAASFTPPLHLLPSISTATASWTRTPSQS